MESRLEAWRAASALATEIDFVGSRAIQGAMGLVTVILGLKELELIYLGVRQW